MGEGVLVQRSPKWMADDGRPASTPVKRRAREVLLRDGLWRMRMAIRCFHNDVGSYPNEVMSLIRNGYLDELPVDPFTGSRSSWMPIYVIFPDQDGGEPCDVSPAVLDVRSDARGVGTNGLPYRDW